MYHYLGLWIRIFWMFGLALAFIIVLFFLEKKQGIISKIVTAVIVSVLMVFLMLPTIKALDTPHLITVEGTFHDESAGNGISPFEIRYSFECDGKLVDVGMDPFSKRVIWDRGFSKGEAYMVVYEETTNLIVHVSQTNPSEE